MPSSIPVLGELSVAEREALQALRAPLLAALAHVITPFGVFLRERLGATCPLSPQEVEDARGACVRHFDQMVRALLDDKATAMVSTMPWPCAVSHTLFVEVTWRYLDLLTRAIEAVPGALGRRETPTLLHALGRLLFSGLALNLRQDSPGAAQKPGSVGVLNTRDAFLLEQGVVGVCLLAPEGGVLQSNARMAQMLGREDADMRKSGFHELILEQDVWRYLQGSRALLAGEEEEVVCAVRLRHLGGRTVPVLLGLYLVRHDDGVPAHFVAIVAQTDDGQPESATAGRDRGVSHDRLTGLPDRLLVRDRIEQAIMLAQPRDEMVAVLLIDLDRFKGVNASLGHDAGDEVLKQTANRLRRTVPPEYTVARLGNDEFIVVMSDLNQVDVVTRTADILLKKMALPFAVGKEDIFLSASIGIAVYPKDGENAQGLLRNADSALYFIKSLYGGDSFHYYAEEMNANARRDLQIEQGLHRALERDELHLHFQPQVDLNNNRRMIGVEALVRWKAEGGTIPPGEFIPVAEKSGLVVQIGDWVLKEACRQAAHWRATGMPPIVVAVNVSPVQLRRAGFVAHVAEILKASGLPPDELELEITEGVLVDNPDEARKILEDLRALGVHLSIDDFGTGYSSLAYLKEFPVNMVKIDRSFVTHIVENPQDAAVVSAVMALSKGMGFNVIAEGVETEAQLDYLRSLGLQRCQGYLTGRPMPPDDIPEFVRRIN